jgi:hypothetical protein
MSEAEANYLECVAAAVFHRAWLDHRHASAAIRDEAQAWISSTGIAWLSMLGVDPPTWLTALSQPGVGDELDFT